MLVNYYSIKPRTSPPGEYDAVIDHDDIYDSIDILNECLGCVYELGTEDLEDVPGWVNDIRGKIHNEPERVFAERIFDEVTYFGMSRAEE
jgi:hypothetical protein